MPRARVRSSRRTLQRGDGFAHCHCCRKKAPFCWACRCGFKICQVCMSDNAWGMSCNGITWQCPDCGGHNGLGNQ